MNTDETHAPDAVLAAALRAAAAQGWTRASLAGVAEDAGVPLAEVLSRFPTRGHMLRAWGKAIDRAMLEGGVTQDARDGVRDRLFDLLMRRFDALAPDREALRALLPTFGGDPLLAAVVAMGLSRSMSLTLEAAGVGSSGPAGLLRVKGLGLVYAYATRVFLNDDTPDLARTMAALDKALDKADRVAGTVFSGRCGRFRRKEEDTIRPPVMPVDPGPAPEPVL
ncbi:hypothetical protein [Pararhodospirillum oryzae]|uniref:TetR family transcriptional regulator n=1 Tax=Pararhodospirillum oryzae TaxID=478448 RepID=A0A512H4B5_9PROT|nr:hypothetical protein [Pararhodospirillum oryzae]GEO80309.1 hypothetical protein ROR02_04400 [Pararhodospirillum oryzae]